MLGITEDPSSGSLVQCLAKNYKNDSIVSVDMDKVGVMAAYSDPLCVCVHKCLTIIDARCKHEDNNIFILICSACTLFQLLYR
jgi:hypothetical protein